MVTEFGRTQPGEVFGDEGSLVEAVAQLETAQNSRTEAKKDGRFTTPVGGFSRVFLVKTAVYGSGTPPRTEGHAMGVTSGTRLGSQVVGGGRKTARKLSSCCYFLL